MRRPASIPRPSPSTAMRHSSITSAEAEINAQVPADSNTGPVKIMVTTCAGTSSSFTGQRAAIEPGLLAPASFYVPGNPPEIVASKQYLVALFQDGATYVGNAGLIPAVPFAPAKPGDTITAYGIGFGAVTPSIPPGVIVSQSNSIPNFSLSFGTTAATVTYAGLARTQLDYTNSTSWFRKSLTEITRSTSAWAQPRSPKPCT